MIRQGTAPGRELLCASRLIPFEKPEGGIRPIAVGDMLYRIAQKAILSTSFRPEMLLPNQLGVNSAGGVEPAIFILNEAIQGPNKNGYQKIASLDLTNAFNTIQRSAIAAAISKYAPQILRATKWAYNNPSILVTDKGSIIASSEGVRQGDPIAPLLFSLTIRPLLERIQEELPQATLVAYLDDIYILNKDSSDIIQKVTQTFKNSPVTLNRNKSTQNDINTLRKYGLKCLGTALGPIQFRRLFLSGKVKRLKEILDTLKNLPRQHAWLLLKNSIQQLLRHLLR